MIPYETTPAQEWRDRLGRPLYNTLLPFFRRHPYRGPVSLFDVDPRGAFSPADSFFYNRIPKSANTTATHMLAQRSSHQSAPTQKNSKRGLLRPSRMNARQVAALDTAEVFTFTIVRNPFVRVLSAYQSKIVWPGAMRLERYRDRLGSAPGEVPDFTTFCRFLDQGGVFRDAHWAPQADLMLLPVDSFDFIGRVESFAEDMAHILRRIWGEDVETQEQRRGNPTNAGDRLKEAYTEEAEEIVSRLYAADFAAFDYATDLQRATSE